MTSILIDISSNLVALAFDIDLISFLIKSTEMSGIENNPPGITYQNFQRTYDLFHKRSY